MSKAETPKRIPSNRKVTWQWGSRIDHAIADRLCYDALCRYALSLQSVSIPNVQTRQLLPDPYPVFAEGVGEFGAVPMAM